ncbi:uncharacterized protein LOC113316218 [Papaver somniferum]|uniref:uncharacterized protein LOC113316218 n=1 Tax=Papaver somniferum TaxID=3469 RepID=UPI000E703107|nr:uncharacterized protein LOC113316218 [Papaver somniferum]
MVELWFLRNDICYDNGKPDLLKIQNKIKKIAYDCQCRIKGVMWGTATERDILLFFHIQYGKLSRHKITVIYFCLPEKDELLLCCDGASRGNLGIAGYGFIVRNSAGVFVYTETGGLGIVSNYVAKFIASIRALEWALENQKTKVILQSDSKACIISLIQQRIPWFLLVRWQKIINNSLSFSFRHAYRETNFSADHFAKKGVYLMKGQRLCFDN